MARSRVSLRLYRFPSNPDYDRLESERAVEKVRALDSRARRDGLKALDPAKDPLISLGMEVSSRGKVKKNSYGVLHLPWMAAENPEWAAQVAAEIDEIRKTIKRAHGRWRRYNIWAGMGGSAEGSRDPRARRVAIRPRPRQDPRGRRAPGRRWMSW